MKTILTTVLLSISVCGFGQRLQTPTLSPFSKASQQLGLTEINLEYSRPSAKGRTIFGDLVPYDKIWRTGANASTKIMLSEAANIGGNPIDSGTYALYSIPGEDVWTIIIHSNTKMRSIAGDVYDASKDVFRFEVKSKKSDIYTETFTLQFSALTTTSCNLELRWANTTVNIPIAVEVDQKIEAQMAGFMKSPEKVPHRTYFEAAQYYLNNGKDLEEALKFIESAIEKSPENFRYGLLKSKIQDKNGDRQAALKTIDKANSWAKKANNANYIEQTELFKQSMMKN